jgi:hypothetical protein
MANPLFLRPCWKKGIPEDEILGFICDSTTIGGRKVSRLLSENFIR